MAAESYTRAPRKRRGNVSEINPPPPPLFSKLGDDLLVEILIRSFPDPKSACRSKPVCKRWSSLITDPRFNRRFVSHHQSMNDRDPPLFLNSVQGSKCVSFLPMPDEARLSFGVLDCSKDLLLCGVFRPSTITDELKRTYLLCNPFTKQWVALPLAPKKSYLEDQIMVARLVCEPCSNYDLELGDGQAFAYSPEYRFRVVRIYQSESSIKLDVFCSESGNWTGEGLVLDPHGARTRLQESGVVSCNSEVFLSYDSKQVGGFDLVAFNPFRLDLAPICIPLSPFLGKSWDISVSRGAVHVILREATVNGYSRNALSVWRLEEDRKSWRQQHEVLSLPKTRTTTSRIDYKLEQCYVLGLHPEKPEVIFLRYYGYGDETSAMLSANLRRSRELEFFDEFQLCWMAFQPKISCWPTPIPRYEQLREVYDGSYARLVQSSEPTR